MCHFILIIILSNFLLVIQKVIFILFFVMFKNSACSCFYQKEIIICTIRFFFQMPLPVSFANVLIQINDKSKENFPLVPIFFLIIKQFQEHFYIINSYKDVKFQLINLSNVKYVYMKILYSENAYISISGISAYNIFK